MVSSTRAMFTFNPKTLAFSQLGKVNCVIDSMWYPTTMALDRQGILHVRFLDGSIYDVDSRTMACKKTPYVKQQGDFFQFEMSYSADAPGASTDKLYLAGWKGWGLETLDTMIWATTLVAPYDAVNEYAVLAGTPDARLFAMFFPQQMGMLPILSELDKYTLLASAAPSTHEPAYFRQNLEPALQSLLDAAVTAGQSLADVELYELLRAVANLSIATGEEEALHSRRMVDLLIDGLRHGAPEAGRAPKGQRRSR